jgi:TonB family protein
MVAASAATSVALGGTSVKKIVLAVTGLCCMSFAMAQSASDAATQERMERAKRDASNPLRIIIEASQVKRTRSGGDAPAPAAAAAPVATKAAPEPRAAAERRSARVAEPTPAPPTPSRTLAAPSPAVDDPPATEAKSAPPSTALETPAASVAPAPLSAPAAPDAAAPADVQAPAVSGPAAAGIAAAAAAAPSAPNAAQPAAEVLAPLKLVHYIEPEIPARIRGRLRPTSEVTVAFKVQPDGSVSQAAIRATNARALDPVVLEAVRQWRYDPVPEEREHVVQLVFNLTE